MKNHTSPHRHAIAMLLAAVAFPATPAFAQTIAPLAPPPVTAAPPVAATPAPAPAAPRVAPPVVVSVAPDTTDQTPTRSEPRASARAERVAPQRQRTARPAPVVAQAPAAPSALTPELVAAPVAVPVAEPAPPPIAPIAAAPTAPSATQQNDAVERTAIWPLALGALAILLAGIGLFAWRRRRARSAYYEEEYIEAPTEIYVEQPMAAAPLIAELPPRPIVVERHVHVEPTVPVTMAADEAIESDADAISVGRPDCDDIAEMVATSDAPSGRPWIELLMRPIRAGTKDDDAVVEFELTVGNAGGVAAKDVRISSWMFAAGSAQDSEMERMLIDPPAESRLAEQDINPGDGARIEAALALPTNVPGVNGSVLPVVVADARYTLPDGSEGRTSASFEVGLARNGGIEAFRTDDLSGLHDDIDARLHREPERV